MNMLVRVMLLWTCLVNFVLVHLFLSTDSSGEVPDVQVFVVTTPAHGENMERLYQNNNGWHTEFPDLQLFTFDPVNYSSRLAGFVKPLRRMYGEVSSTDSNLHLAAFEEIFFMNQESDWYLLTEDDTIIAKKNLDRFVNELNAIGYKDKDVMLGRCMGNSERGLGGAFPFIVGGSGILMSRTLLQKLAPIIPQCRQKYGQMAYGDARVGACVYLELNISLPNEVICKAGSMGYSFTNGPPAEMVHRERPEDFIVALHEKDPSKIARYYKGIRRLTKTGQDVTWRTLFPYLNTTSDSSAAQKSTKKLAQRQQ